MDRRLGVLAFGDSITNGGGELQWGVALQSWALWTARGLGVPYTGCAVDGASAATVVAEQIPRFLAHAAAPDARYDVGCLYVGVNDVRGPGWDARAYERDLRDFGARNRVMVDAVHPTAFGQVEIAERALATLARDGLPTRVLPSTLIHWETTRWKRLRGDATYAYRQAKQAARIAWWRARTGRG